MILVTIGTEAEAEGHPSACGEVVTGEVQGTGVSSLTVSRAGEATAPVATVDTADIHFEPHDHEFIPLPGPGCTSSSSHDVDPDDNVLPEIRVNGSKVYTNDSNPVTTDPESGGNINIIG